MRYLACNFYSQWVLPNALAQVETFPLLTYPPPHKTWNLIWKQAWVTLKNRACDSVFCEEYTVSQTKQGKEGVCRRTKYGHGCWMLERGRHCQRFSTSECSYHLESVKVTSWYATFIPPPQFLFQIHSVFKSIPCFLLWLPAQLAQPVTWESSCALSDY